MPEPRAKNQVIRDIENLTAEVGFIYTLASLLHHNLFLNPAEAANIDWNKRLSFQEFTFLIGLMVKRQIALELPTKEALVEQAQRVYELFEELHFTHLKPFFDALKKNIGRVDQMTEEEKNSLTNELFGSGEMMSEPIFYGGSGAYDFQYWDFAPRKYKRDSTWFKRERNIDINVCSTISANLKKISVEKAMNFPKVNIFSDFCKNNLDVFLFQEEDLSEFNSATVQAFIQNFSLIPGTVNNNFQELGQYNSLESHPIIQLPNSHYFLPISFNLAQSISESPFYWMSLDNSYKEKAFKNRGLATEEIASEILIQVFGKENVYRNVQIRKSKKVIVSDIDVLVLAGNKAIILQAKSKKLTELSKRGDTEQLKNDFELAVQKAYEQGLVCRKSLLAHQGNLFDSAGNPITLDESIDDAYIICITSDHYPAVAHQVDVYLRKRDEDPFPVAMSIFDLDILAFYLTDPFEFLYYIRQRVTLTKYFIATSEIAFLGYHLNQKLIRMDKYHRVSIQEDFAQLVDANFPVLRGHFPKTKAIDRLYHKWKNEKFEILVEQIKETKEPGFTDAIFFLYDLAGKGADDLVSWIEKTKKKTISDGKGHDVSLVFENGKSGLSFICQPDSPDKLGRTLLVHSAAKKYKTKADMWLGIGTIATSNKMIDAIVFVKESWKFDHKMEEVSGKALKKGMAIDKDGKKIGRNEACICGSGKKYKKCCGI